jgi:hypothetical protein
MYTIKFQDGVAEVTPAIGRYLIERGLAFKSPNH